VILGAAFAPNVGPPCLQSQCELFAAPAFEMVLWVGVIYKSNTN
jgi:hypothetical protein